MDRALKVIDALLPPAELEGTRGGLPELLDQTAREGLELQRATIMTVRAALDRDGEHVDVKLLRAGNDAAAVALKIAARIAEAKFRAASDQAMTELLGRIAAAEKTAL